MTQDQEQKAAALAVPVVRAQAAHAAATVTALSSVARAFPRDRGLDDAPSPALSRALRSWLLWLRRLAELEEQAGHPEAAEDTRQLIAEITLEFNLGPDDA